MSESARSRLDRLIEKSTEIARHDRRAELAEAEYDATAWWKLRRRRELRNLIRYHTAEFFRISREYLDLLHGRVP